MRTIQYLALAVLFGCAPAPSNAPQPYNPPPYDPAEARPGGAATVDVPAGDASAAFSKPVANLPDAARKHFQQGAELFYTRWIAGPAPAPALTGLGPFYSAISCEQCHRNDGRGRPFNRPHHGDDSGDGFGAVIQFTPPDPIFGAQLQDRAITGLSAETEILEGLAAQKYTSPVSLIVAPPLAGIGLLEAIPAAALDALADPDDANGDGISGKRGQGRFGLRAGVVTVLAQSAKAFSVDMGISTSLYPDAWGDCTKAQPDCRAMAGSRIEASDALVESVAEYVMNLGVPARENADDPGVLTGRALFYSHGCQACHTPSHKTGEHRLPWLSGLSIWPYSDLLLHDMGAALADGGGPEWRTPALWGLGRHKAVNGNAYFLHDGRADSIAMAITLHGGEGEAAAQAFRTLPRVQQDALLAFLKSL